MRLKDMKRQGWRRVSFFEERKAMLKKLMLSVVGAGVVLGAAPAFAGEWKLNPRACPDLVEDRWDRREDRRDARVYSGRQDVIEDHLDRQENWRDEAVTICPARALYYQPSWKELKYGGDHAYGRRQLRPPLKYDRWARMNYIKIDGRKIYIRAKT